MKQFLIALGFSLLLVGCINIPQQPTQVAVPTVQIPVVNGDPAQMCFEFEAGICAMENNPMSNINTFGQCLETKAQFCGWPIPKAVKA